MVVHEPQMDWNVLLIGGGVGSGKSTLSLFLAERFKARAIEGDLLRLMLVAAIPREVEPDLHLFSDPGVWQTSTDELVTRAAASDRILCRAAELVVARQGVRDVPSILEAAWITPEFAAQSTFSGRSMEGQVRSLFLYEPDVDSVRENMAKRTEWWGHSPRDEQEARLRFFHAWGIEMKRRAEALGLPVLESRPFSTLIERALVAIGAPLDSFDGKR